MGRCVEQRFYDVEIDELNEPHVTRHGISVAEIHEVLRNDRRRAPQPEGPYRRPPSRSESATPDGPIVVAFAYDGRTARPIAAWEEER